GGGWGGWRPRGGARSGAKRGRGRAWRGSGPGRKSGPGPARRGTPRGPPQVPPEGRRPQVAATAQPPAKRRNASRADRPRGRADSLEQDWTTVFAESTAAPGAVVPSARA